MAKYAQINSAVLLGLNLYPVIVESFVDSRAIQHDIDIVGLGDTVVKESKKRIKSAIYANKLSIPTGKVIINLAPGDLRKEGTSLDLPMAISMLGCDETNGFLPMNDHFFFGELALDGKLRAVRGVVPLLQGLSKSHPTPKVILPVESEHEASLIKECNVYLAENLTEVISYMKGQCVLRSPNGGANETVIGFDVDFSEVHGQYMAKRALEIAAAGGHHLFMKGPPGSGKTMLAQRLPTILPPLSYDAFLETLSIYSISGKVYGTHNQRQPPFRAPHHTASRAALIGGGPNARPGEVSLAHNGVLFLDEVPEFPKDALECLRQPLEEGMVQISRVRATLTYPARFSLVAAQNPCMCGNYGDPKRTCNCSPRDIIRYNLRISGPLRDRMDIMIEVPRLPYEEIRTQIQQESSESIRNRVMQAREIQINRQSEAGFSHQLNASLSGKTLKSACILDQKGEELLEMAINRFHLTGRGINKILRVARTIADLNEKKQIEPRHVAEAIQFREKRWEDR